MKQNNSSKKWYDNVWLVFILCFLFFPVGLYALWKNNSIKLMWKILGSALIGLLLIGILAQDDTKKVVENKPVDSSVSDNQDSKSTTDSLKDKLNREINSFNKPLQEDSFRGSVEALQSEVVLFSLWASVVNEGNSSKDIEVVKLAKKLSRLVINKQLDQFPKIRKEYGKIMADKLWESNVYVTTQGKSNHIINLTGGLFANNKNIAETQRSIGEILNILRFKEVRYRWYKGADEYTSYKIESSKDDEIIDISQ